MKKNKGQFVKGVTPWWIEKRLPNPMKSEKNRERMRKNNPMFNQKIIKKTNRTKKRLYAEGKLKGSFKNCKHSEKTREKIRKFRKKYYKTHDIWNKGITKETSDWAKRSSIRMEKNNPNKDGILWQDTEYQKKLFKSLNRKPTKPEEFLIDFFKQHNLSFKYTGDYSIWIKGKNPDFLEANGKKLIIEFNGYYKHNEKEELERAKIFSKYGFKTLFLHYPDLKNKKKLLNKICEFVGVGNK